MIKKRIKNFIYGTLDRLELMNATIVENNKYKDERRIRIYKGQTLTKEQIKEINEFYVSNYGKKIPLMWHQSYMAYTGKYDKEYFPELLYIPKFERYMNYNSSLANVLEDKNLLYVFAKNIGVKMPHKLLACQDGIYTDENGSIVSHDNAAKMLSDIGDCFAKPSIGTDSGRGCGVYNFTKGVDQLSNKMCNAILDSLGKNFVIQERLKCHESIRKLYDKSVNTFRIMTYRWHDQIIASPVIMRIGQGGAYLDNAHAGGMFIALSQDGTLHKSAFTELDGFFEKHPDSGIVFSDYKIEKLPEVVNTVQKMHSSLPSIGVINWDMTLDEDGIPVLIEANVNGGSVWLFQMAHGCGVFRDRTAEILQWIRKMDKLGYAKRQEHHFGY